MAIDLAPAASWVPFGPLARLALALLVGLFVGLEREWRGKEAGLRTFGLVSLLGAMGATLGASYAIAGIVLVGVLVVFLNVQSVRANQGTELTTSAALLVTSFTGVLAGLGHTITPVAVAVVTAGLLSWKERLAEFGHRLTAEEIRSAILLGILAFAVYPVLPTNPLDPWGLIAPRAAWTTVLLIAAIGFVNYVLWKLFGTRGIELTGFLGGLVNSTVTVTELSLRTRDTEGALVDVAYRGVVLSVAAMAVRNAVILGIFEREALLPAAAPLALMLGASAALGLSRRSRPASTGEERPLAIRSPFSLRSALKFGVVFLVLQLLGSGAQAAFGRLGFYAVSFLGGLVSSASSVAAAAMLATHQKVTPSAAGTAAVLASLASAGVNLLLVARLSGSRALTRRVGIATLGILVAGIAGVAVTTAWETR